MPLIQFIDTVQAIRKNKEVSTWRGILRHLLWQWRKVFGLFPFELRLSESRIIAHTRNIGVAALINCQGMYDYHHMMLLKRLLASGGVFLDVGANVGSYSLIASEQSLAKVHAFEPHPTTFQFLLENIQLNNRRNVFPLNVAVGKTDGEVMFTDSPGSATNHLVLSADVAGTIRTTCIRLDTFCRTRDLLPNIVKIDVEGFEYDVLMGAGEVLPRFRIVFLELNGLSDTRSMGEHEIVNVLHRANFVGPLYYDDHALSFSTQAQSWRRYEDAIFVSSQHVQELADRGYGFPDEIEHDK
jgi:FkbM family methyltransferase